MLAQQNASREDQREAPADVAADVAAKAPSKPTLADNGAHLIKLKELPAPPPQYKALLDRTEVQFSYGPRSPTRNRATGEFVSGISADRLAAETQYTMAYDYKSQPRWFINHSSSPKELVVRLRFRSVQIKTTHEVWFRQKPPTQSFWENPLVRHELDHVSLSSDPRLAKRFDQWVTGQTVIRHPLDPQDRPGASLARARVDAYVEEAFGKIAQLTAIRYRELDRLTRHGRDPVAPDSSLSQMLRESAPSVGERP